MNEVLNSIRAFGQEFSSSLYDTGFGDIMACGGVQSAETREDMRVALTFVNGYAQACRLANTYQSAQWLVCNDVAALAGQLSTMLDSQGNDPLPSVASFYRVISNARESLLERLRAKAG